MLFCVCTLFFLTLFTEIVLDTLLCKFVPPNLCICCKGELYCILFLHKKSNYPETNTVGLNEIDERNLKEKIELNVYDWSYILLLLIISTT